MRKLFLLLVLSCGVALTAMGAQNNQATVHLRGRVLDSTGLPMAATSVKVYRGSAAPKEGTAAVKEGQTNDTGDFDIEVPSGDYYIEISAPDFNSFKQAVKLAADTQPLAVTLTVKTVETVVDVSSEQNELGVDPDSSLTTDTITGDALLDLPDNEEDLLAYLQELAAARGIVDGELNIRVDGFENSYLPNKAEISEIRIINNSFSADGNSSGPRIEIVTRPGTGFWTGNVGFNFGDESLNAAAPLTNGRKPASQTRNFDAGMRGPIIPGRITANITVQNRESENEGNAIRAVTVYGPIDQGIARITKQRTFRFGPNITLNKVHSIVANFNYTDTKTAHAGVGGFTLPERATDQRGSNWTLQLTERANFSSRFTNEFRIQVRRSSSATIPVTDALAINVQDAFNGGGAPNRNSNRSMDYQIANTVRWQPARKLTLTMEGRADYHDNHSDNRNNYLGTYTFASLHDYCYAENFPGTNCEETRNLIEAAEAAGLFPTFTTPGGSVLPITGVPTQFRITIGNPVLDVKQAEFSAFVQGEYRIAPRAQLSFGARYQAQQHLDDYNNIAPTLGLSYQLSTKQNWQTVVAAGARMNYQTYSMGNWEQLLRNSGNVQTDFLVLNSAYPLPTLDSLVAQPTSTTTRVRQLDYAAGYTIQPSFRVDQSLPKGHRLSFIFQINRGVHQSRNRNINAPYPGTMLPLDVLALLNYRSIDRNEQEAKRAEGRAIVDAMRLDPTRGNINQQESSGKSLVKNFSLQYRLPNKRILNNKVQIGGNLTWAMNWAEDDNGTPVNNYDIAAEWGRSSQDQRHRFTASLNILVPWNLRFNFSQVGWNSGRPYTITTGQDLNGDGANNDRPDGFGRNTETAPSYFNAINMTVTKTIILRSNARPPAPANDYVEPQRGGGGFGGGGGGGFGGQGGGGGGGRGRPDTRQIQLSVQVRNLFNSTIRTGISGVMSSPLFGQPTGGGQGRQITLSVQTNLGQLF
jgi:hypothetical protein